MGNRFVTPVAQFEDDAGLPLSGGTLTFYLTGSTTPANIWTNAALSIAAQNPQDLDADGNPEEEIFLDPSITYKVVLKDAAGATIWTRDPVVDPAANVTAAIQVYAGNPNGNVAGNAGTVGGVGATTVYDITNHLFYVCTTTGVAAAAVWTQVGATLSGAIVKASAITPTTLAADTDNYAPTGGATAAIWRLQGSAVYVITGINISPSAGQEIELHNIGTFDLILRSESASSTAANRFTFDGDIVIRPGASVVVVYDGTSSRWRQVGRYSVSAIAEPGGRLTMSAGVPVPTGDVASSTSLFFTPYKGTHAPLWNGNVTRMVDWRTELSLALDSNSGHTGYHQSGKNFDVFVVDDAGTIRLGTGPAWTNDTTQATAIEYKNGFRTNAASMTLRFGSAAGNTITVPQNYGLWVGTVRMSADGTTKWIANPAAAAGGGNCQLLLWNVYHRKPVAAVSKDSTDTWTYATATWRSANNNTANRITAVFGLNEDAVSVIYNAVAAFSNSVASVGVGLDVTNAYTGSPGVQGSINTPSSATSWRGRYDGLPGIGSHFFQAVEIGISNTTTFHGDNGTPLNEQTSLIFQGPM